MSDSPVGAAVGAYVPDIARGAERIAAELVKADGGTDPFAAAVRATRMPMVITNPRLPDNPVVFANAAFCRLTGYVRDEILGRNCRFLQGPDTDRAAVARIREAVEAARSIEIDIRNHRKNGEPFWNRLLMAPVHDAEGQLAYFFASQVDVTLEREKLHGLETHNAALMAELAGRLRAQQDSEARLRFATEAGRLGIWDRDLRTNAITGSAIYKATFGRKPDEPLTFDDVMQSIHPDDRDRVTARLKRTVSRGLDYDIEYRVIRPDKTMAWVQIRAQVMRAEDGSPLRLAGISLDITERRAAELKLELSEQFLRLATDAAEVGAWDLDMTTDVLTWSDRTRAMFGISAHKPVTMADFFAGLHPDDLEPTSKAFALATDPAVRATYDVEYRTIGKEDGVVRWVAAKGRGIFEDGRCIRALGVAIDITARQIAERRQAFLLALWDRLRALTEPRAIMSAAAEALGRYLGASRVGYGQVQDDDASIDLDSSYVDGVASLHGKVALKSFGVETVAQLRRGETVMVADVAGGLADTSSTWARIETRAFVAIPLIREGKLRAILYVNFKDPHVWTDQDIDLIEDVAARTWDAVGRARAEAQLRDANDTLEQRIAEALVEREAAQEALRQSQKMEALGQLTGGVAHDFNNLLQIVMGNLETVTRGLASEPDRLRRAADNAMTGARRAATLTQRLLAFSRRQPLDPKPIDANALVDGMSDLLTRALGETIELETHLTPGLWWTEADPNQLESAILNLVVNARDAMPDGGKLTIETANVWLDKAYAHANLEVTPGPYVSLSVTDNGAGMDKTMLGRVFEPFFTTKEVGKGTGLGLAMVYGFVKQSGGHVKLYSELGAGTSVKVYLPRRATDGAVFEAPAASAAPKSAGAETILVVEDDADVRTYSIEVLHELGYRVLEAQDAVSALAWLASPAADEIALLFTDVVLPGGMTGADLARQALKVRPTLKVLFTTGYARDAIVHQGRLDEGVDLITKPFTYTDLAAKLREALDGAG
jgi:PAS domain S-box-containing protein